MADHRVNVRLSAAENELLDRLSNELVCDRSSAIRYLLSANDRASRTAREIAEMRAEIERLCGLVREVQAAEIEGRREVIEALELIAPRLDPDEIAGGIVAAVERELTAMSRAIFAELDRQRQAFQQADAASTERVAKVMTDWLTAHMPTLVAAGGAAKK